MTHAHHHEDAQRPIRYLPRSLVSLLVGPVLPVDFNFLEIPQNLNFYPAVSLHLEVKQVFNICRSLFGP